MKRIALIVSFLSGAAFITFSGLSRAADEARMTERYTGVARDQKGATLYTEKHEVEYKGGQVTKALSRYFSNDGALLAELSSEFPVSAFLPKYRFKNFRTSMEEGVNCCFGDELEVFRAQKRKRLRFDPNWVSGQGFHYLARQRLDLMDRGEKEHFQFLIPSRLEAYPFRIRSGGRDPEHPNLERILLEIDQWFFRIFAPKIMATYDLKSRRLIRYEGPSNLESENGKIENVTIDYRYED